MGHSEGQSEERGEMGAEDESNKIAPKVPLRKTERERVMSGILKSVMKRVLKNDGTVSGNEIARHCKLLSDVIKDELKLTGWERRRYVVQVMIGEQRGQGVNIGSRCFWLQGADSMASESFVGVSGQEAFPLHMTYARSVTASLTTG